MFDNSVPFLLKVILDYSVVLSISFEHSVTLEYLRHTINMR